MQMTQPSPRNSALVLYAGRLLHALMVGLCLCGNDCEGAAAAEAVPII